MRMIFKVDLGIYLPIKPIFIMDFGIWGPDVPLKCLFTYSGGPKKIQNGPTISTNLDKDASFG